MFLPSVREMEAARSMLAAPAPPVLGPLTPSSDLGRFAARSDLEVLLAPSVLDCPVGEVNGMSTAALPVSMVLPVPSAPALPATSAAALAAAVLASCKADPAVGGGIWFVLAAPTGP